jgi:hypothetical protein
VYDKKVKSWRVRHDVVVCIYIVFVRPDAHAHESLLSTASDFFESLLCVIIEVDGKTPK